MNNPQHSPNASNNDEIDLFELIITLWRSKWLIIGITIIGTALAFAYASFAIKPSYQSTVTISVPEIKMINGLNKKDVLITKPITPDKNSNEINTVSFVQFMPITPEAMSKALQTVLKSPKTINDFYKELPSDPSELSKASGTISINPNADPMSISTNSAKAENAFALTNAFLEYANGIAAKEFIQNSQLEIQSLINKTQQEIIFLENVLSAEQNFKINELKNSYETAEKLDMTLPQGNSAEPYLLGTEILAEKIAFLEKNQNDYTYNNQYNILTTELKNLNSIQLPNPEQLVTYSIVEPAETPTNPVPTKKKLIIIIGFLLGGMVGVGIVLLKQAIRSYRERISTVQ